MAMRDLARTLSMGPKETSLRTLWHHLDLEDGSLKEAMALAQAMTLSILLQLEYYLSMPLKSWPMRLFRACYATREGRFHECEEFFKAEWCCCDDMSRKIREVFADGREMAED
eukprot:4949279-Pyramimonas_sp.AAC.1